MASRAVRASQQSRARRRPPSPPSPPRGPAAASASRLWPEALLPPPGAGKLRVRRAGQGGGAAGPRAEGRTGSWPGCGCRLRRGLSVCLGGKLGCGAPELPLPNSQALGTGEWSRSRGTLGSRAHAAFLAGVGTKQPLGQCEDWEGTLGDC